MPGSNDIATQVLARLRESGEALVLAESCTAGLIAATLAETPGASDVLAGSAVAYQVATKTAWLEVSAESIAACGVVSAAVAAEMAVGVLQKTPHATIALAITGHLGPDAPSDLDGIAWLAVARRSADAATARVMLDEVDTVAGGPGGHTPARVRRQRAAATAALRWLMQHLPPQERPSV